jgi:hypothetical protein
MVRMLNGAEMVGERVSFVSSLREVREGRRHWKRLFNAMIGHQLQLRYFQTTLRKNQDLSSRGCLAGNSNNFINAINVISSGYTLPFAW